MKHITVRIVSVLHGEGHLFCSGSAVLEPVPGMSYGAGTSSHAVNVVAAMAMAIMVLNIFLIVAMFFFRG